MKQKQSASSPATTKVTDFLKLELASTVNLKQIDNGIDQSYDFGGFNFRFVEFGSSKKDEIKQQFLREGLTLEGKASRSLLQAETSNTLYQRKCFSRSKN